LIYNFQFFSSLWCCDPIPGYGFLLWGFSITLFKYITLGRTLLDEWSTLTQQPLPDNTQHLQETNIHAAAGFEPTNPASKLQHTHALHGVAIVIDLFFHKVIIFVAELHWKPC
jgi:hypothetical protein